MYNIYCITISSIFMNIKNESTYISERDDDGENVVIASF
jgi:hypothetical protein